VLVIGAIGGWMAFQSEGEDDDPIVVGTTVAPTMVDPAGTYDAGGMNLVGNLFQSLMTFAPGQQTPVPDAARSCGFTDNQLTVYRCTLRSGLTFSNGEPVTPQDVKFSYERTLAMADRAEREAADDSIPEDEKFAYGGPAPLLDGIEAVRTDGDDIIFELSSPNATFPFVVASSAGAIVHQGSYEELEPRTDGQAVGSGPFVLTGYQPDAYAELEPNPDYVGAAEIPEQPVTVRYFVESGGTSGEDQLARAWHDGELDVNDGDMPPDEMAEVGADSDDQRVYESVGGEIRVLAFNTDEGMAMADPAARRVAAALMDREAISRHVRHNTVEPLYSLIPMGFPGHGTPYYDEYADDAEADPDELRAELEDAGLAVPVRFELAYSSGAASHEEAELLERQLEADGLFDVRIEYYDWAEEFIPAIDGSRTLDSYMIGWVPDFPDPATFTDLLGPADGLSTGFGDPEINELISETQAEANRGRAAEDFLTINELAAEQAPIIPIWQNRHITLSDPSVGGIESFVDNSGIWRLWALSRL
jgi:peptide/nickel transport system substrate-binding protein